MCVCVCVSTGTALPSSYFALFFAWQPWGLLSSTYRFASKANRACNSLNGFWYFSVVGAGLKKLSTFFPMKMASCVLGEHGNLVGGIPTYPSEKWWSESQLGWWHSQHMEKNMFQTSNQQHDDGYPFWSKIVKPCGFQHFSVKESEKTNRSWSPFRLDTVGELHIPRHSTGWWCNNHLEKYEFVNGTDDISYFMDNKKCLKPPTSPFPSALAQLADEIWWSWRMNQPPPAFRKTHRAVRELLMDLTRNSRGLGLAHQCYKFQLPHTHTDIYIYI